MTNELAIKISHVKPAIDFRNFEELKNEASKIAEDYSNLVVTGTNLPEIKNAMAKVNRTIAALDQERKKIKRELSEPIASFESQIKELNAVLESACTKLGSQIKIFEEKERRLKEELVKTMIANEQQKQEVNFPLPIQASWLNKTASQNKIRAEIIACIERYKAGEVNKQLLEKAREERIALIEQTVNTFNAENNTKFTFFPFMKFEYCDLKKPINQVLADIRKKLGEYNQKNIDEANELSQDANNKAKESASQSTKELPPIKKEVKEITMAGVLVFTSNHEDEIMEMLDDLKMRCLEVNFRRQA